MSFICVLANGMSNFCALCSLSRLKDLVMPPAPGALMLCLVDGKTKKGSDLALKLKYFEKDDWIKNEVSLFILRR